MSKSSKDKHKPKLTKQQQQQLLSLQGTVHWESNLSEMRAMDTKKHNVLNWQHHQPR